jgi:hypothetical protein
VVWGLGFGFGLGLGLGGGVVVVVAVVAGVTTFVEEEELPQPAITRAATTATGRAFFMKTTPGLRRYGSRPRVAADPEGGGR